MKFYVLIDASAYPIIQGLQEGKEYGYSDIIGGHRISTLIMNRPEVWLESETASRIVDSLKLTNAAEFFKNRTDERHRLIHSRLDLIELCSELIKYAPIHKVKDYRNRLEANKWTV